MKKRIAQITERLSHLMNLIKQLDWCKEENAERIQEICKEYTNLVWEQSDLNKKEEEMTRACEPEGKLEQECQCDVCMFIRGEAEIEKNDSDAARSYKFNTIKMKNKEVDDTGFYTAYDSSKQHSIPEEDFQPFINQTNINYNLGNVIKHVLNSSKATPEIGKRELLKAQWYLETELDRLSKSS